MKLKFKMERVIESHFIKTSNYGVISILINLNEKWCDYAVYTRLVESGANGEFVDALYQLQEYGKDNFDMTEEEHDAAIEACKRAIDEYFFPELFN
mgnify:CR=1 FL=1